MKSMFTQRVVTLNIEAHSLRALVVKGERVEEWGSVPLPPGLVKEGLVLQPQALGHAINRVFATIGAPKRGVVVSLTGLHSTLRTLALPRAKRALLDEAIQRKAKKEMPVPLEELYLSWASGMDRGGEQEFCVLGVPRNLVDAEVQALRGASIKPGQMYIKPLALARLISRRDALIIDLEPASFAITLVTNGNIAVMRTISPKGNGAILEDNARWLTEEISRIVDFYNREHPENPFPPAVPAFLTGELSGDAGTVALVQAGIEYPLEPLVAPLECPPDLPVASYAVNLGLALMKTSLRRRLPEAANGFSGAALNILPDRYTARRWTVKRIVFPLAAALVIGGLLPAYQAKTLGDVETARLQAELNRVTRDIKQMRLAMSRDKELSDALDKAVAARKTLEQEQAAILDKRGDFTRKLQLVVDALPPGARFTAIAMAPDRITLRGVVDSAATAISYAQALEAARVFGEVGIAELGETTFGVILGK